LSFDTCDTLGSSVVIGYYYILRGFFSYKDDFFKDFITRTLEIRFFFNSWDHFPHVFPQYLSTKLKAAPLATMDTSFLVIEPHNA